MTKRVTVSGGALYQIWQNLPVVDPGQRIPVGLLVQIRRLRASVEEFIEPWLEQLRPLIAKHADGATTIPGDHPNRPAFDDEAAALFDEQLHVEFDPIDLGALAACDAVQLSPRGLEVLVEFGVVVE